MMETFRNFFLPILLGVLLVEVIYLLYVIIIDIKKDIKKRNDD